MLYILSRREFQPGDERNFLALRSNQPGCVEKRNNNPPCPHKVSRKWSITRTQLDSLTKQQTLKYKEIVFKASLSSYSSFNLKMQPDNNAYRKH